MFLPSSIGPVTVSGQIIVTIITSRIVKEIGSGAETMAVDHPSGGLRVVQNIQFADISFHSKDYAAF